MPFSRISDAIATCRRHLDRVDIDETDRLEIQTYLVASLLFLITSHYEAHVRELFTRVIDRCDDRDVCAWARALISARLRSPSLDNIRGILKELGGGRKDRFNDLIKGEAEQIWINLLEVRNGLAHTNQSSNMTLHELDRDYPKTKKVISALESVLK